jgi:hypothetical protein
VKGGALQTRVSDRWEVMGTGEWGVGSPKGPFPLLPVSDVVSSDRSAGV